MIQTTLIGHACLYIQSEKTNILTDPVWFDYLWEEINVLCPSIILQKDKVLHTCRDHMPVEVSFF